MTVLAAVAIAQAVALAAVVLGFLQHIRGLDRQGSTRRASLRINQVMHAARRTWEEPPSAAVLEPAPERHLYRVSPEQHVAP